MALDLFYQIFEIVDINTLDFERMALTQEASRTGKAGELIRFLTAEEVRLVNKSQLNYKASARFGSLISQSNSSEGIKRDDSRADSCNISIKQVSKNMKNSKVKKKRKGTGFVFGKNSKNNYTQNKHQISSDEEEEKVAGVSDEKNSINHQVL